MLASLEATVVECACMVELKALGGYQKLQSKHPSTQVGRYGARSTVHLLCCFPSPHAHLLCLTADGRTGVESDQRGASHSAGFHWLGTMAANSSASNRCPQETGHHGSVCDLLVGAFEVSTVQLHHIRCYVIRVLFFASIIPK